VVFFFFFHDEKEMARANKNKGMMFKILFFISICFKKMEL